MSILLHVTYTNIYSMSLILFLLNLEHVITSNVIFLLKLLLNHIDCVELLALIPINVPTLESRNVVPLYTVYTYKTYLGLSSPIYTMSKLINELCKVCNCDIFNTSLKEFKQICVNVIRSTD